MKKNISLNPALRYVVNRNVEMRAFEYSDEAILTGNVKDMAEDLADVISRIVRQQPLK